MRYVKFVLIPGDDGIHPADKALADEPTVERELIQNINLLEDSSAVTIYQLRGSARTVKSILSDQPKIRSHDVTETRDTVYAYIHFEPNDAVRQLLRITREHELVLDTPMEFTPRGGLRLTVIGEESTIRKAIPEIPEPLRAKLEQMGDYEPYDKRLYSLLTDRQQEAVRTAVDMGYYSDPRRATHEDLANEIGCSPGTVGEHLRKVEAKILPAITP